MAGRIRKPQVRQTLLDRAIGYVAPGLAVERLRNRTVLALVGGSGAYTGSRRDRRATSEWITRELSANGALLGDLPTLRDRSNDLMRNEPLARGAVNTVVTNVLGPGLMLRASVDREMLGLEDAAADAWERDAERLFRLWSGSKSCDATRTQTLDDLAETAFRSVLVDGDHFVARRFISRKDSPFGLALQLIDGARVVNPGGKLADTPELAAGVERDRDGAPVAYHVLKQHPGDRLATASRETVRLAAFGSQSGERMVWHLFRRLRADQARGEPYLAPVIEPLKQLGRYSEAEVMAAVISAFFTVFVKSEGDGMAPATPTSETGGSRSDEDYKMAPGAILDLAPGEDISTASPGRPNAQFDPFVMAILRQIGVALEVPFELLVKHFTASYSAARAALLEAWKFFRVRRAWIAREFYQQAYEALLGEAVALGLLDAPGFFADPLVRAAWCGAEWIGPSPGQIDPVKETEAVVAQINARLKTRSAGAAELTGTDWDRTERQLTREDRRMREDGVDPAAVSGTATPAGPDPERPDQPEDETEDGT